MKAYIKKFKSSALIQSCLITGLCLVIYWLGPISVWESNDDALYNLLFSGQLLTSSPEPHIYSINFVLSSVFAQLYTLVPHIHWYGNFHVTALLVSIWFLNYCYALVHGTDKFFLRIAISLTTLLPFLFLLQFTKTAMVLAVSGYLGLYLLSQANFNSPRQNQLLHVIAVFLLIFSFTLRKESFLLMTFLCGGLMMSLLLKRNRKILVVLLVTAVLILSFSWVHKSNFGDEWRNFNRLSQATTPILDYNQYPYEENQKVYTDAGLSRNDYYFLKSWGYADSRVYSPERLNFVVANAAKTAQQKNPFATLLGAVAFPAQNYLLTAFGLTLLLLLVYRQQYGILALCVLLPFLISIGILAWQGRFPTRVSAGMIFFLPWAVVVVCGEMRSRWLVAVASVGAVIALAFPVYGQYHDLHNFTKFSKITNQDLHTLGKQLTSQPISLLFTLQDTFPYQGLLPFESPDYLAKTRFIWLCGMNQTPVQKKQLTEQNIDDLFLSLIDGSAPYIVIYPGVIQILRQYIFEHYRTAINVIPVFRARTFSVYRVSAYASSARPLE